MTDPITAEAEQYPAANGAVLQHVSNALVALHKEQFGRGPTRAQTHFAGADTIVCVLDDAQVPAERTMVETGELQSVRESRMCLQVATADKFIAAIEAITGRTVRAFASASDPDQGVVMENFVLVPEQS